MLVIVDAKAPCEGGPKRAKHSGTETKGTKEAKVDVPRACKDGHVRAVILGKLARQLVEPRG
jgi:hypothetical protein